MKLTLWVLISLIILLLGCNSIHSEEEEEQTKFLVSSPIKKDTTVIKEYVCQIHAISHIEIRSQERGYLEKIYIDEGQFVKKGQLLFKIMPRIYAAETQKAKAEKELAEIEYQNTKALADKNIVSKNELAMAKAKLDRYKAELSLAQVHLDFTEIRAPFDGIVDKFKARLGSFIDEGDLLTSLSDNSKMWVYFNVPEAEYLNYKMSKQDVHAKVNLLMANNQMFEFDGIVETIEADFNNETGNIAFRATFPNPKGLLRHGETGNIQMASLIKDAIIIPQKATYEVLEKRYVFVVNKDNIVNAREIEVAAEMPDLYFLKNGLIENEKIIIEGIRKVKENQKITYTFEKPELIMSKLKIYTE